ncbi:MAG: thiosulfate oxidation carrier complex protein SoxZ [Elsteraceae bacterium]
MARNLINVPKTAKKGEIVEIKILISHPMESGQARDAFGKNIPRDIIHSFSCHWGEELVFRAELFPAIAANPYFAFYAKAEASGKLRFNWKDDQGQSHSESAEILVEG